MKEILRAVTHFKKIMENFFVYPSADLGGKSIICEIDNYVRKNNFSYKFKSLNQKDYFSFVKNCDVVIGNSLWYY